MRLAACTLKSISPYSQSKYHSTEKLEKENAKDYETRTWRERLHYDKDGIVFIPAMAFKNCIAEAAKYLSVRIPGKGKATYTKHFEAGVLVTENLSIGIHKDQVEPNWLFVPSDGRRGGSQRVEKCFPLIHEWSGVVEYHIFDDTITEDVFTYHLGEAGRFIGIGTFRPRNNGYFGRFEITAIDWS